VAARLTDLSGQRYGRLTVLDRAGTIHTPSGWSCPVWRCRCDCGAEAEARGDLLRRGDKLSCGCLRREVAQARGEANRKVAPGYRAAHSRVKAVKGAARSHACAFCGAPATQWAYWHGDPDELTGLNHGKPTPYSADPDCYEPMCQSCHGRFDRRINEIRRGVGL